MTQVKHTEGPWTVSETKTKGRYEIDASIETIAVAQYLPEWDEEARANARLNAAAPELLHILMDIVFVQELNESEEVKKKRINDLTETAKEAIKKAIG